MNSRWSKILHELLSLPTAPQCEASVAAWLSAFASQRGYGVRADRWGNMVIHAKGSGRAKSPWAFCAHMDHPGFKAGETRGGVLHAEWRGRVPQDLFAGAPVRFFSDQRWVKGTVLNCAMPDQRWCQPRAARLRMDGPVAPGSAGMWDFPDPRLRGTRLYARGHDCVTGCAAIACLLDEVHRRGLPGEFYVLFTRAEEGGLLGATGACQTRTLPKRCRIVALETSRALLTAKLGDGAVIRVGDWASIFDPGITALLWGAAEALGKRGGAYQRKLMDGGICESTVYSLYGYRAGALCLPLGNYHNVDWDRHVLRSEVIDTRDYTSLVHLLIALVRGDAPVPSRGREEYSAMLDAHGGELLG